MPLLHLIRLPNLLIVALTQYLLYDRVILATLREARHSSALNSQEFSILTFVTILITAGGYIINDLADLRIDRINRPDRVIIGRKITHQTAYWLYFCINFGGFVAALYLALVEDRVALLFLHPLAVAGLLLYAIMLKKRPLSGNVLVSLYCAGVAGIVWVAEQPTLSLLPAESAAKVQQLLIFYAVFAFFSTLFREIVKDLEDMPGDAQGAALTIPVAWGISVAKWLAGGAGGLLLLSLAYAAISLRPALRPWALPYFGLISALIVVALYLLARAQHIHQYHSLSQFTKIIILGGILLLLFF